MLTTTITIRGSYGEGKSFLATRLAFLLCGDGFKVDVVNEPQLMEQLKQMTPTRQQVVNGVLLTDAQCRVRIITVNPNDK